MAARYRTHVQFLIGDVRDADEVRTLMPQLLTAACLPVVPADGAGLSSGVRLRIPSPPAARRRGMSSCSRPPRGDGPCLSAALDRSPSVADLDTIAERWPIYHRELLARSAFRSTCALPSPLPWPNRIVLDLHSRDPKAGPFGDAAHLHEQLGGAVAELIAESLGLDPEDIAGGGSGSQLSPVSGAGPSCPEAGHIALVGLASWVENRWEVDRLLGTTALG